MSAFLSSGEPAPWFSATTGSVPADKVAFDELAGRYIVLFFFGTAAKLGVAEALAAFGRREEMFDRDHALFIGISNDPDDFHKNRLRPRSSGYLFLLDSNGSAAKQYKLAAPDQVVVAESISPVAFIVSPALQIVGVLPMDEPALFDATVVSCLRELLGKSPSACAAPILVVPEIFEPAFCRRLVDLYEAEGGREIGQIEKDGMILERTDPSYRRRLDHHISDAQILMQIKELLIRRLLPIVYRAFQFPATRIERYLVACYDAENGGYFRPHRDNTAAVVAHRRFALTIGLNDTYEGGFLCFPEFGGQSIRPDPGQAIVFSCSLLHEVTPITLGRRYAFISFLYDEQSQRLRDRFANNLNQ